MASFVLLLAILLGVASVVFALVSSADELSWANQICSLAPHPCDNPHQLAYAALALAGLWLVMRLVSAARG